MQKGLRLCRGVLILRLRLAAVNIILSSLRELSIFQHLRSHEATAEVQVHVQLCDVLRHVEVVGVLTAASRVLDAEGEDAQLIKSHGLALEQQLTQAHLHLDEHATDGGLREYAVVRGHVRDELVELHQLAYGTGEPLAVSGIVLVSVLVKNVIYHDIRFKGYGTVAVCKGTAFPWFLQAFFRL